jgi:Ca-activated chloride channel homolog
VQTRETELTGPLALISAMLAVAAAGLSVLWFGRIT